MNLASGMKRLPTFAALETLPVLDGDRPGATIRLDETYFQGVQRVLASFDEEIFLDRITTLRDSLAAFREITVQVAELATDPLLNAATEMRSALEAMPEMEFLEATYPGECFVIPQLLYGPRGWFEENQLQYGARVFFFPPGKGPSPEEIIERNVLAVVGGAQRDYEQRIGSLLGYPDCCIERFLKRTEDRQPEIISVAPLKSKVHGNRLRTERRNSLDSLLDDFFADAYAYAFFSREFFPEPWCEMATERGRDALGDDQKEATGRRVRY